MKNLRTHGKSAIVWVLMGMLVLGLGGFGVTSFTGGSSGIGSVGGTVVTADEYARALRGQMMAIQQQTGRPMNMSDAQAIGLPQAVQAQLFTAAALEEQARLIGVSVGDDQVRQAILNADSFKGPTGRFDRAAYAEALRREQMNEAEFENAVRTDEARLLIQRAVAGGVAAPQAIVDRAAGWLLETRDLSFRELTEDQLSGPVAEADEDTLIAWHQANAARFTAPEIRRITYVWMTPEMLADEVELDEAALRVVYEDHIDEFQQPERRMVSRLVFPSETEAEDALRQISAGEASFEDFVLRRGLTLDDVDMGDLPRDQLGAAGDAIFALEGPGVVGPIQTNLGPALFSMNAILDPIDISFEQAQGDLRAEAAANRAMRMIEERSHDYEDMLAGGTTLEDVAEETALVLGQIDWIEGSNPEERSIAGYQDFRDRAGEVTEDDFPELYSLADGGVFALRLDEIVPPTLKPFEDVRGDVIADWRRAEAHRQLLALADEERLAETAAAQAAPETQQLNGAGETAPEWTAQTGLTRDGWIETAPQDLVIHAFAMEQPGEVDVVDTRDRVFLVRLDAIHPADLTTEDAQRVISAVTGRMAQSLQIDVFDYYARAAQMQGGLRIEQQVINAVNAQAQ